MLRLTIPETVSTGLRGIARPDLLLELVGVMAKMNIQLAVAKNMPETYDKEALRAWRKKYEKAFQ
ncbi:MAG TPA: hypothetical protein DDY98_01965 [Ruminococcaceae bacterium]|nr:hypothetical protein [Oscillospiraceae bacterium]